MKGFRRAILATLHLLPLAWAVSLAGCGDAAPSTTSPIVAADSEAGKKALAEDEAERRIRKQKEARAFSRLKKAKPPDEE